MHRGSIAVIESRLFAQRGEKENWIVVYGVVTNRTSFAWKELEFDCRYFDASGTMIDAKTIYTRFTLVGFGETGFRVELKTPRPLADYAAHKVEVKSARNASAWP